MSISVRAVYKPAKPNDKFDHIEIRLGEKVIASPINFLRISEMKALEDLLKEAWLMGATHIKNGGEIQ